MDEPITKRLIISGLTPSITVDDLSRRLTTFGTVKAADGFGLPDGLGTPRNFGYVTLDTTVGKLARCMNLLSGSTWKGAKLRFGEAKPDFKERIDLENKKAAEEPPKKKRKRFGGVEAEDMTLISQENAAQRPGWKVSSLGRITKPMKMRPVHPLPEIVDDKPKAKSGVVKFSDVNKPTGETEKKRKKRVKDPDSRARRKVIDMTKYGSTHLKGMFLDLEAPMPTERPERYRDKRPDKAINDSDDSESSGSEAGATADHTEPAIKQKVPSRKTPVVEAITRSPDVSQITRPISPSPVPNPKLAAVPSPKHTPLASNPPRVSDPLSTVGPKAIKSPATSPQTSTIPTDPAPFILPENNIDIEREKAQSLNLLNSLFGNKADDDDWVGQEELDSDIDISELVKGDRILPDDEVGFEIVPRNAPVKTVAAIPQQDEESEEEEEPERMEVDQPPASAQAVSQKDSKPKTLKDLFAPRDEEVGFSLLGHLDLDLELDEDPLTSYDTTQQIPESHENITAPLPAPITLQTHPSQAPLVLDPRQALFFPLPKANAGMNRARQRDVYDLAKDNGWNWRDPAVGFYQTGTEEDIRKRWEDSKGELTRDWKRRCREAGKVNRRKRGGVDGGDDF